MKSLSYFWKLAMLALSAAACTSHYPQPFGPVPSKAQVEWQRMEINMFCHFGPNTFTGVEWGSGNESEEVFNPLALDCHQWVKVAKQAGMQGIIITAKHHDGFCLWPSAYSTHTVTQSTWNEETGDVMRQFSDACRGHIKAGVYISPWDRNHPDYGTSNYNVVFSNTLKEVHTKYGPFFEQWLDGACGEGPNGKRQEYDWQLFEKTVLDANSKCIIFSDTGPGCRWVGNEEGYAEETNWSTFDSRWVPAEVDVSIRPGWFWHPDEHPKTVDELMEIYFNSVGRNGLLLLNVPPDNRGLIPSEDSAVLVAFRAERDRIFANDLAKVANTHATSEFCNKHHASNLIDTNYHTYWAAATDTATVTLTWEDREGFDIIVLQEYIPLGQRITHFEIAADGKPLVQGTTVGYKRIVRLPHPVKAHTLSVTLEGLAAPVLNRIALYNSKAK